MTLWDRITDDERERMVVVDALAAIIVQKIREDEATARAPRRRRPRAAASRTLS
jgi:hypothetical protein